ncbi:MAG: hypothetical protein LBJ00_08510 [Planctomycetaceae bacterium]|nr:hypothetical protein [Planctomycetaceae bacterium]
MRFLNTESKLRTSRSSLNTIRKASHGYVGKGLQKISNVYFKLSMYRPNSTLQRTE